jgi:hypothetical protein
MFEKPSSVGSMPPSGKQKWVPHLLSLLGILFYPQSPIIEASCLSRFTPYKLFLTLFPGRVE